MSSNIKISVVIPIYNRKRTLRRCIDNVLSMDYPNLEIILVDDCSSDDSYDICKKYADKYSNITSIRNESNLGPGLSRNAGLNIATGDYIIFLDSDDKYDLSLLSSVANAINEKHPDILIFGLWEEYYSGDHMLYRYSHSLPGCYLSDAGDIHRYVVLLEEETMLGYPWNKAYRLDYLRECGAIFSDIAHVEDILFNIDAFENAGSIMVLEDKLYHYCNEADNRLTDKYLSDYFKLQKKRIIHLYNQQKRWKSLDEYALSVMSGEYFRWLMSAVERQINADIDINDIYNFLKKEYKSKLYVRLCGHFKGSIILKALYFSLTHRSIRGTILTARLISMIKRYLPHIFNILKQHR